MSCSKKAFVIRRGKRNTGRLRRAALLRMTALLAIFLILMGVAAGNTPIQKEDVRNLLWTQALAAGRANKLAETIPDTSDNGDFINESTHIIVDGPVLDPSLPLEKVMDSGIGYTTMHVCSTLVGNHGMCVLIENVSASGKKTFGLIDTGNASPSVMNAFLKRHGADSFAFVILTHMHKDHVGNAVYLLSHYPVASLYLKQYDAAWSEGLQSEYERILRTAVAAPNLKKIVGVSYALSTNADASPGATKGFVSFLKKNEAQKGKFKGLFNQTNTTLQCGSAILQIFNWEIWAQDGVTPWKPGINRRGHAGDYSVYNSDNNFSLGVRVTQGTHRLWIGGDINDLRLQKKPSWPYAGDEGRLKNVIGRVDAAILNHHGRGGSNTSAFLKCLSPKYVVYTSTRDGVVNPAYKKSMETWNCLTGDLHLSEDQILWACNYNGSHPEDPSVTITEKKIESAYKDGSDMEPRRTGASPAGSSELCIPLKIGRTYSSYDVTGDGKPDQIMATSSGASGMHSGLKVMVNQKTAWSTKLQFKDSSPVTLVLLPGRRAFLCVSILSPAVEKTKTSAVKTAAASSVKGTASPAAQTKFKTSAAASSAKGAASSAAQTKTKTSATASSGKGAASPAEQKKSKTSAAAFTVKEAASPAGQKKVKVAAAVPGGGSAQAGTKEKTDSAATTSGASQAGTTNGTGASTAGKTTVKETRIFAFYSFRKTKSAYTGAGVSSEASKAGVLPGFTLVYNVLHEMPDPDFEFNGAPSVRAASGAISLSCTGKDALTVMTGTKAALLFSLVPNGSLLKLSPKTWKYCLIRGKAADPFDPASAAASAKEPILLFGSPDKMESDGILLPKKKFTVEEVRKNKSEEARYLITVPDGAGEPAGNMWWIAVGRD